MKVMGRKRRSTQERLCFTCAPRGARYLASESLATGGTKTPV